MEAWTGLYGKAPSARQAQYAQAIAFLETGYGRAGQFGALAERGQYNWGALERRRDANGDCPPGTAPGSDQGSVCFYIFPSDVAAAKAFIHTLTQTHWPGVIPAMDGSPEDVAAAMRKSPAYYAGPSGSEEYKIQTYANAIRNAIKATGQPVPSGGGSASSTTKWLLIGGLVGGGLYWYSKNYRLPKIPRKLKSLASW